MTDEEYVRQMRAYRDDDKYWDAEPEEEGPRPSNYYSRRGEPEPDTRPIYKERKPMQENDEDQEPYMDKTRRLVRMYIEARLDKSDPTPQFEVYLVWFAKTLQNWKCLVSSTLPDGMYYEVTYNGDKKEAYIDAYKKVENVRVADTLEQPGFQILEFDQSDKHVDPLHLSPKFE